METKTENVSCVYNAEKELVAIIKRDDLARKSLVYMVAVATTEEISNLIINNQI